MCVILSNPAIASARVPPGMSIRKKPKAGTPFSDGSASAPSTHSLRSSALPDSALALMPQVPSVGTIQPHSLLQMLSNVLTPKKENSNTKNALMNSHEREKTVSPRTLNFFLAFICLCYCLFFLPFTFASSIVLRRFVLLLFSRMQLLHCCLTVCLFWCCFVLELLFFPS